MRFSNFVAGFVLILLVPWSIARAEESVSVASAYRSLVPHRLLPLLHAPEVHEELGLSDDQVVQLESWFANVDGPWFRLRIEPDKVQLPELDRLEGMTRTWIQENLSQKQRRRIQELEWQSLGARMMLRNDFARELKVTADQQRQFSEFAKKTESLQKAAAKGQPANGSSEALARALQNEQDAVKSILHAEQQRRFSDVVGTPFETQNLKRIYPMAPELVPTKTWFNSSPFTLESMRGKVVLVHFYAFECHNCQANFNIYKRWHEKLLERGVVVLGIQTPETPTERDPNAVCKAARDTKLQFPILIDLESENWKAWGNTMWPTVYVIDKRGYIRHWWQGELNWQGATGDKTIEQVVEAALAEPDPIH